MIIFQLIHKLKRAVKTTTGRLLFTVLIVFIIGVFGIHIFEGQRDEFSSLENKVWWFVVTMTTVGYGDLYPVTTGGRILTMILMIVGISVLGVVLGHIASTIVEIKRKENLGLKSLDTLKNHTIICGWNSKIQDMLMDFHHDFPEKEVVIITNQIHEKPPFFGKKDFFVKGDPARNADLEKAGIKNAENIIVLSDRNQNNPDMATVLSVLSIKKLNPKILATVELNDNENLEYIQDAGADNIISIGDLSSKLFIQEIMDAGITNLVNELLSSRYGNQIIKNSINSNFFNEAKYKNFKELVHFYKKNYNVIVFAAEKENEIKVNPENDYILDKNSKIFYIGEKRI